MSTLAQRLTYLRQSRGMSVEDLAVESSLPATTIQSIEAGNYHGTDDMDALAMALRTTKKWLVTGEDESLPAHNQAPAARLKNLLESGELEPRDLSLLVALANAQVMTAAASNARNQAEPITTATDQASLSTAGRVRLLLKQIGVKKVSEFGDKHGIGYARWRSVASGNVRVSTEEVDVLVKLMPSYALWLTTGNQCPAAGQLAPAFDK